MIDGKTLESKEKSDLAQLLSKLEDHFGVDQAQDRGPVHLGDYDVAVIGGGPAGVSASIYAARKGLKTVVVADSIGGQVKETRAIENMISVPHTQGPELSAQLRKHVDAYDIKILEHRRLSGLTDNSRKKLELDTQEWLSAASVIVATGAKWRELGIPGEKAYTGKGVAYCPHCDGPFYKGKDVAVIGGGNSGVEAAIDLAGIVGSVRLIEVEPHLKADHILVEKVRSLPNVTVMTGAMTTEITGNGQRVTGIEVTEQKSGKTQHLDLSGVFVQIGLIPNSGFLQGVVETNPFGEIVVDEKCRTSVKGIYAAGDVTTVPFKQIVISMGEGAKAALSAFEEQVLQA